MSALRHAGQHTALHAGGITSESVPVAAPASVADRLANAPDGPLVVLHASPEMVHLDLGGRAVGVAAAGAPGLPHAVRTELVSVCAKSEKRSSPDVPTAYLDSGILYLGGRALVAGRLVDVRAPRLDLSRIPKTSPAVALGTPRPRGAGLVALPRLPGVPDIDAPVIDVPVIDEGSVPALLGRGDGLTPLGDDVLCGWLAAHRAAGVATPAVDDAVRRNLARTTTLSATLLECALAGEVADLAAAYLRSLGTPEAGAARAALEGLGHSSGAGLAHGIELALHALSRRAGA